jgi:hypothetical protein
MKLQLPNTCLILFLWLSGACSILGQGTEVGFNTIPKNGTVMVYAHQDDDLIWMLPFWEITEKFIGGAMPTTTTFNNVVSQQQTYLYNNGLNIDYRSNWIIPWNSISQNEYNQYYWDNNASYNYLANDHLIAFWDNNNVDLARREVNRIKAKLEQYIASPNVSRIITHNNWGEYGHQHHKAINKAVRELAVKYRKDVWMLGCNNGNFVDITVPDRITYTYGSYNSGLFSGIRNIYKANYCWTWTEMIPSGTHKYIEIVERGVDKSDILTREIVTRSAQNQLEEGSYIFDGYDDYLTIPGNNYSSFTIAMSIMPDQIRNMDIAGMAEYPFSEKNDRNFFLDGDGRITARIFDGSSRVVTSSARISSDTWTHIAITGSGSNLRLYINGTLDKTISTGTAITNYSSPEFVLGQATSTDSYFIGQINDVRLFNRVLSGSEIAQLSGRGYTIASSTGEGGSITPAGALAIGAGSDISFNIRASSGYRIADVRVDNLSVGTVSLYEFNDVSSNHSISASFQRLSCSIGSVAGAGGNIDPEGEINVTYGSNRSFSIEPEPGYQISDVRVDNVSVGAVSEYIFYNITTGHTISALFTPIIFNIESKTSQGGSINPEGITSILYGHDQIYSITPARGFQVDDVLVDNNSVGAVTNYSFRDVTSDHSITAEFKPITYTLAGISGPGGSISPSGITSILYGQEQSYSFTPEKGFKIEDVIVDNVSMGAVTNYSFRDVTSDHSITAEFKPITYTLAGISGPGGSISPAGITSILYGHEQSYSFTPEKGFKIEDVIVDNVSVGAVSSYFFRNITSDHSVSVKFSPCTYTLAGISGPGGSISPAGITSILYGHEQSYSFTPEKGFKIEDVIVDNVSVGAVSSYLFGNITSDHSVSVEFAPITFIISGSSGHGGQINPEGEIEVNFGNDQQYYIIPDYGYKISNVIVDYHPVYVTSNEFSFNSVERNHTISVTFSKIPVYVLETGYCINGSISPAKDTSVFEGSDLSYSIVPSPGYRIYSVFIDSTTIGPVSGYTFNNISADHIISATFSSLVEPVIYPNPFRNEFRLTIRSPYDYKYDISILTLGNRIVYTNQEIPANTTITLAPEIPPGFYILNILYKGRIAGFSRIVKN